MYLNEKRGVPALAPRCSAFGCAPCIHHRGCRNTSHQKQSQHQAARVSIVRPGKL